MIPTKAATLFVLAVPVFLPLTMAAASIRDRASAIVVGEVVSGRQNGNSALFDLSVVRTLKGSTIPGATITITASLQRPGSRDLSAGYYGMWFLEKAGVHWAVLPLQAGFLETAYYPLSKGTSPAAIATRSVPSTVDDQITVELAAALESYTSPLQFQLLAHGLLAAADSPVTQDAFQALRTSSDPELKFIALARSLRNQRDVSGLAELANSIDLAPRLKATSFVADAVLGRLDSDPVAIGYLGQIAASSDPGLQGAAAHALMCIHTRNTLPFLAQLLDSNDAATRECAMRGLSSFVENLPIATQANVLSGRASLQQGPAPYRTADTDRYSLATRSLAQAPDSEVAFLQFWRSWWASMKNRLTP